MFEVTGHGMDFATILPYQAHTCISLVIDIHPVSLHCNSVSLHATGVVAFKSNSFFSGCADAILQHQLISLFTVATSICRMFFGCVQATATALQCSRRLFLSGGERTHSSMAR